MGYIQNIRKKIGHDRLIAVGAGVFVYKDGKVLLQKRRDNLCWALHGGVVEIGEVVENAAKRELLEETGLIAGKLELLGVFSGDNRMYTYPNGDEVYIIGIIYICRDFAGELLPKTDETVELKWFDIDDLPKEISPLNVVPMQAFVDYIKRTNP
ncbi:ADP-ribose pyrophosphatase YjhB, NUDIX family [Paenibacillus sp. 1_12]|nr:ADP-ribose pyrophosphatase YjhB, NUDIX family [Paenibacillus sp. 1_12]